MVDHTLVSEYLKHLRNVTCISLSLYNLDQKLKCQSSNTICIYHPSKSYVSSMSGLINNLVLGKVDTDIPKGVFQGENVLVKYTFIITYIKQMQWMKSTSIQL